MPQMGNINRMSSEPTKCSLKKINLLKEHLSLSKHQNAQLHILNGYRILFTRNCASYRYEECVHTSDDLPSSVIWDCCKLLLDIVRLKLKQLGTGYCFILSPTFKMTCDHGKQGSRRATGQLKLSSMCQIRTRLLPPSIHFLCLVLTGIPFRNKYTNMSSYLLSYTSGSVHTSCRHSRHPSHHGLWAL